MATKTRSRKPRKLTKFNPNSRVLKLVVIALFVLGFGLVGRNYFISNAAPVCVKQTFKQGSSGQCVKYVQELTNWAAPASLTIDGQFELKTKTAVKKAQSRTGLTADGIVGKNTWYDYCYYYSQQPPQRIKSVRKAAGCDTLPPPQGA